MHYYELFWYCHHTFIILYIALMLHGIGGIVKIQTNLDNHPLPLCRHPSTWGNKTWEAWSGVRCDVPHFGKTHAHSWMWVVGPLFIYFVERLVRIYRSLQHVKIEQIILHPSRVMELQMHKRGVKAEAGQFVYLYIPSISRFEWHPYTLTSAPEDDVLSVHIRICGDWTGVLGKICGYDESETFKASERLQRRISSKLGLDFGGGKSVTDHINALTARSDYMNTLLNEITEMSEETSDNEGLGAQQTRLRSGSVILPAVSFAHMDTFDSQVDKMDTKVDEMVSQVWTPEMEDTEEGKSEIEEDLTNTVVYEIDTQMDEDNTPENTTGALVETSAEEGLVKSDESEHFCENGSGVSNDRQSPTDLKHSDSDDDESDDAGDYDIATFAENMKKHHLSLQLPAFQTGSRILPKDDDKKRYTAPTAMLIPPGGASPRMGPSARLSIFHAAQQGQAFPLIDTASRKSGGRGDEEDVEEEETQEEPGSVRKSTSGRRRSILLDMFMPSALTTYSTYTDVYNSDWEKLNTINIPVIGIDGPYGTASMHAINYEVTILIGAGIGVTPFASLLKSVWYRHVTGVPLKCRRVYFWWVCKDTFAFEWFTDMMKGLLELQREKEHFLEYALYITSATEPLRTPSMISCYSSKSRRVSTLHAMETFRENAHRGRPDWDVLFEKVAQSHCNSKIGVFFCGPKSLSKTLARKCLVYSGSPETECNFFFHKENF